MRRLAIGPVVAKEQEAADAARLDLVALEPFREPIRRSDATKADVVEIGDDLVDGVDLGVEREA